MRHSSNSPCLPIEITLGSRGGLGVTRREPPIRGAIGRIDGSGGVVDGGGGCGGGGGGGGGGYLEHQVVPHTLHSYPLLQFLHAAGVACTRQDRRGGPPRLSPARSAMNAIVDCASISVEVVRFCRGRDALIDSSYARVCDATDDASVHR